MADGVIEELLLLADVRNHTPTFVTTTAASRGRCGDGADEILSLPAPPQ